MQRERALDSTLLALMKIFRPSGAGVVGKQGVVYETHLVARASRPCGTGVGGFFSMLFVN
jgi:hypothetical protein